LEIIEFEEKDKKEIFDLFSLVYKKKITEDFWNWRYYKIPYGKPVRYVMKEQGKIVGHYVVQPFPLKIKKDEEKVMYSLSVMTHPEFRGKNIFAILAGKIYSQIFEDKYRILIGFPNQNSLKIHFEKLNWHDFGQPHEYYCDPRYYESQVFSEFNITKIDKFGDEINTIWEKYKNKISFIIPRNSTYLNWRFIEHPLFQYIDNPKNEYFSFLLDKNNEYVAYFVLKKYGTKFHLVDFFGEINWDSLESIIDFSIKFAKNFEINELSFWLPYYIENNYDDKLRKKFILQKRNFNSHFGINVLSENRDSDIFVKDEWFILMSDCDVF